MNEGRDPGTVPAAQRDSHLSRRVGTGGDRDLHQDALQRFGRRRERCRERSQANLETVIGQWFLAALLAAARPARVGHQRRSVIQSDAPTPDAQSGASRGSPEPVPRGRAPGLRDGLREARRGGEGHMPMLYDEEPNAAEGPFRRNAILKDLFRGSLNLSLMPANF
jgi:hypothetical protein